MYVYTFVHVDLAILSSSFHICQHGCLILYTLAALQWAFNMNVAYVNMVRFAHL